ncbi:MULTISPECIES: acyl-CoA dehydrogenase family protein [Spongiibacter]|uniref:acyl-CoA dehydrogenase family protein n=3 Tax=Spongiibacteraceae TaxID=1706375 RepID=UPI000C645728|nr:MULTISPECIES: acyl-CoA dehydrogenase family protein [Spongiibacter]MAY38253.1 acyl-CoA dehydrogenase [Spongiibacter sp.]MBU73054.1 acyl-CoA dehydrogenase [Spongiibacter sp.]|tara:strand:+ start:6393 stop:7529 length:1137 start_codon:yes stop_codon:yes gene_type:complete
MALVLNEEQRLLKDTAKDFLSANMPVEALRKLRDSDDEMGYSREHWQQMCELGWASIVLPEEYDGLDFGFMGLGAVIEESGRVLAASPLMSTVVLGASILMLGASDEQKAALLPKIASGELTLALAMEEGNHHAPLDTVLRAEATASGYRLSGSKSLVTDGYSAEKLIVLARSSGKAGEAEGLSLFLVDGNAQGVSRHRRRMADSRGAAAIDFDVEVSSDALIGELGKAWPVLEPALDRGRICLAAEMLGGAQECFQRTVEYLKERSQFGVKIGSFQALQHRASLMYIELELAKSVVLDALSAIDDKRPDMPQLASLAKARLNDVFELVTSEAVQMHGGIGVTDELEIGFFLKRSRMASHLLGNSGFHRDRYASLCGY